jgi:virginiamycin A acetyltransferase
VALLKRVVDAVTWALLAPLVMAYHVQRIVLGRERAYGAASQRAARWPGVYGQRMRKGLLRRIGTSIGVGVDIGFGTVFRRPPNTIGDHVAIGHYSLITTATIGDYTLIGDRVAVYDGRRQHGIERLDVPMMLQEGERRSIVIGRDCLIGSSAVILADVGSHAVVGAGSVVTEPVPEYAIVAGVPARQLADRRDGGRTAFSDGGGSAERAVP